MNPVPNIRAACVADAHELFHNLRPADFAELSAIHGDDGVHGSIINAVESSTIACRMDAGGKLLCLYGLVPLDEERGIAAPWMLGTPDLDNNPRIVLQQAPVILDGFFDLYSHLTNATDCRNTKVVRWLKWLGFAFCERTPIGADRVVFQRFELVR